MLLPSEIRKEFADTVLFKENISGAELTTFALGGKIGLLLEPKSIESLSQLFSYFYKNNINYKILGNGSNLVISDSGVSCPVIKMGKVFNKCFYQDNPDFFLNNDKYNFSLGEKYRFIVQASSSLMSLSRQFTSLGFSGLEFAAGIPASLGGAVYMNAGAHGGSISEIISKIFLILEDGKQVVLNQTDINFQYRQANLPENSIVYAAELEFSFLEKDLISQKRTSSLEYRKLSQPLQFPSAGSVFKNPSPEKLALSKIEASKEKIAAAELLEKLGLKGYARGGVSFSKMHANWLIKISNQAKAADVEFLINYAKEKVETEFGIILENEIIFW